MPTDASSSSRPPAVGARRQIPNLLTTLRLVLAGVFFGVLAFYDPARPSHDALLVVAAAIFLVAALTDALDGRLARRWNAVTVFGRVMDPFADKVLVLGAFVMLAGANFSRWTVHADPVTLSGVETWMVVVILARELLVTSIRGIVESKGISFAAIGAGKIKMIAQSVAVPLILVCVALQTDSADTLRSPAHTAAIVLAWGVTLLTAWSAIPYLTRGWRALRDSAD